MEIEEVSKNEQEHLFEEELKKSQYETSDDDENDDDDDDDENDDDDDYGDDVIHQCRLCHKIMSNMRKTAVRWLYMEWYKKAVLGQQLPTISELTPTLANVLKNTESGKRNSTNNNTQCNTCLTDLDSLINKTLKPITNLSEMYSSLPRNWTVNQPGGSVGRNGQNLTTYDLQLSKLTTDGKFDEKDLKKLQTLNGKENVTPAASFFYRAAQKLNLASKPKSKKSKKKNNKEDSSSTTEMDDPYVFPTNFSDLIMKHPPQAPQFLFKNGTIRRGDGHGKVRLMLRVNNRKNKPDTCLTVDAKKKQVLLRETTTTTNMTTNTENQKRFEKAPRLYSFDNIFERDTPQAEVNAGTLVDLLHTVVNGNDACLLTYGYPKLGKTSLMVGKDNHSENVGSIPCAISWLYQLIDDRKERTGARFSIRVSAVEVVGKSENLKDLLGEQGNSSVCSSVTSPSVYLPRERACSVQLSDFTELRAPNAEKAAFFFDAAVASRTSANQAYDENGELVDDPEEYKNSNMIFTLHVYQYMIDKVGTGEIHGGRSRFHLIDLSGCSRKKRHRDTGQGTWLPLSALGNVLVALSNGAKHIPHRDSKLTTLLREAMGSLSSRVTIIANVSEDQKHCFETLSTLQLTSRIHRSRKKKSRYSSTSSSGGDSSCDERRKHRRRCKPVTPLLRTEACQSDNVGESEFTSTSAAEESCDTVIYVGPRGGAISDRELTDFEHPPSIPEKDEPKIVTITPIKPKIERKNSTLRRDASLKQNTKPILLQTESKTTSTPVKSDSIPIVVTINDTILKSPLEEKANTLSRDHKTKLSKHFDSENCSESLPIRSKNRCYSIPTSNEQKHKRTSSLRLNRNKNDTRQSLSANVSPSKPAFNDSQLKRSNSLDRPLHEASDMIDGKLHNDFKSTDTVSSIGTVQNFERQLVSKIAERFALEEEFSFVDDVDQEFFTPVSNEQNGGQRCSGEEFYIDDDLQSIGAELEISSPVDHFPSYHHANDPNCCSRSIVEESEQRNNDVIHCNNCIGECHCVDSSYDRNARNDMISVREYDSAEDTDERTDDFLRLKTLRNRKSVYSSCDSHLDHTSPRNFIKRAPSEGVSSGYESMRWESNTHIHVAGDSSNEKSNKDKKESIIYEIRDDSHDTSIEAAEDGKSRVTRTARHHHQIKELIEKRQDLKEELHQTLKKLVLNRVPLPDIDDRLHELSESKHTKEILTRENRILEKKVKVCKSHLQLVNSLDNTVVQSSTTKKKNPYQRLSAKIKSKLGGKSPKKSNKNIVSK